MRKLTIMTFAILFFACEGTSDRTVLPTEPQSEIPGSLSKKPDGNKGKGGSGGTEEATFLVTFSGDVAGGQTWPQNISSGSKNIGTPYGYDIDLELGEFICFSGTNTYTGPLIVGKSGKNDPFDGYAWFWFYGAGNDGVTDVNYILKMSGNFVEGTWPPTVDSPLTIDLTDWNMTTEGKRNKKAACIGDGNFTAPVTLVVTRTQ